MEAGVLMFGGRIGPPPAYVAKPVHHPDEDRILQLAASMHKPGMAPTLDMCVRAAAKLTGHACRVCHGIGNVHTPKLGEEPCPYCDMTGVDPSVRYIYERVCLT